MKHMRVKDLIKKLEKCDPEAKIIIENTEVYVPGMYYVTSIDTNIFETNDGHEIQVILDSNYKSRAKGWD